MKTYEIFKNGTQQGEVQANNIKEARGKVFATYGEERVVSLKEPFKFGFKLGSYARIDKCYLTDEVGIQAKATPTAKIISKPTDSEELVRVKYTNGLIDYIPQDIIIKL